MLRVRVWPDCACPRKLLVTERMNVTAWSVQRAVLSFTLLLTVFGGAYAQPVESLVVEQEFLVGEETDEVFFGRSIDVHLHDAGHAYVIDAQQNRVVRLQDDGRVADILGEKGRGPGEFVGLKRAFIHGERLVTYDVAQRRIVVFSLENGEVLETTGLGRSPAGKYPSDLAGTTGDKHLIKFIKLISQPDPEREPATYRWLYPDQTVSGVVASQEDDDIYMKLTSESLTTGPLAYGREVIVRVGQDGHVFACRTGEIAIAKLTASGDTVNVIRTRSTPIPVTEEDRRSRIEKWDSEAARNEIRDMLRQSPDTWPLFRNMLVDTERIWLDMVTRDRETRTWLALNDAGEKVATFTVPENVRITSIRGSRAAGVFETEEGAQLAVSYTLRPRSTP